MKNPQIKCKACGQDIEISQDGWLLDEAKRDKRNNIIYPIKREVKYFEWIHLVGHMNSHNTKLCKGSGSSPVTNRS
jgi:hypothetical protein